MDIEQVIPRDAIPSVDDPSFGTEYVGEPADLAIVLDPATSPARAYPIPILAFHEIVNETVDDIPVVITWCPLCGSAVVYDRTVAGRTLTFGVSGKLADDDLVMYDRETDSEWKQSTGHCIEGHFEGRELSVRPAAVMRIDRFREAHPAGVILQPPGGKSEAAGSGSEPEPIDYTVSPYRSYVEDDGFGLGALRGTSGRQWNRSDIDPKEPVLGIVEPGDAVGIPRDVVRDAGGVRTVEVGERAIIVLDDGTELHAFSDPGFSFRPTDTPGQYRADGAIWEATSGESDDGRALDRVATRRVFAFAWQDDHGPDSFLLE